MHNHIVLQLYVRVMMDMNECMVGSTYERNNLLFEKIKGTGEYIRPHLNVFLQGISEFADVYGCTACPKEGAVPVFNYLDPQKTLFKRILYREDLGDCPGKDLRLFGDEVFIPERTVLVDDCRYNFCNQPSNGLLVPKFRADKSYIDDTVLLEALALLRQMSTEPDIRVNMHMKIISRGKNEYYMD